jgi:Domain of unknown function (DUF4286)
MTLYNIAIKVDWIIDKDWVKWMKEEHIPAVMATNCFTQYTFAKLIEIDEEDGPTYSCQYIAQSKADYNRYIELHSSGLQKATLDKWGNKYFAFRSLMQVVQ